MYFMKGKYSVKQQLLSNSFSYYYYFLTFSLIRLLRLFIFPSVQIPVQEEGQKREKREYKRQRPGTEIGGQWASQPVEDQKQKDQDRRPWHLQRTCCGKSPIRWRSNICPQIRAGKQSQGRKNRNQREPRGITWNESRCSSTRKPLEQSRRKDKNRRTGSMEQRLPRTFCRESPIRRRNKFLAQIQAKH